MTGDNEPSQQSGSVPAIPSRSKPVILCVEDEPELLEDIGAELSGAGYNPVLAADGVEALRELESHAPDIIMCDITMPRLGGRELLRIVRTRRPDLADVPFIFLTALGEREDMISAKLAGADDYLVKPVDFDLMLASIDARLDQVARMRRKFDSDAEKTWQTIETLSAGETAWDSAAARALDFLALGIVFLDRDNRVVFANEAAYAFSIETDGLCVGRQIQLRERVAAKQIFSLMAEATDAGLNGIEFTAGVPVGRASNAHDVLALICSLPGSRSAGAGVPVAVAFLSDPARRLHLSRDLIASLFGLTPTEAEIALELTEGHRREAIAERLGITNTTVAFHMRNLFQKTGTNRQADLVAKILVGVGAVLPEGAG
ncbi:response regulator [Roseibium salinum]|uniref:Response regulator n=1 Tax=Roseibium salinum TaxID=1604349 RepID=A0ABT3R1L4_9HYPH|nr:response regulator [Roseibium sp. DSM 29163]MCX2723040.1 response regulator [Roseibium sp. DSM 29163]